MRHRLLVTLLIVPLAVATEACGSNEIAAPEPQQIRYGDDPAQFGWLTLPTEPSPDNGVTNYAFPVVVLIHGGFWKEPWDYTLMNPMAGALAAEGVATWNVEFRRLGGRGGWPETFDDVDNALEHLSDLAAENPLDTNRVVVVGHSSGGHLAMWSLSRQDRNVEPVGVVALAPIVDLTATTTAAELLGGAQDELPDRYLEAAPVLDPDLVVVLNGTNDSTIGPEHGAAAVNAGVRVEVLDEIDHFEIIEPTSDAWPVVLEELTRLIS